MKAALSDDWDTQRMGSIVLNTETGVHIAEIRFVSVNSNLISMRNYHKEMRTLAERLIATINAKKA